MRHLDRPVHGLAFLHPLDVLRLRHLDGVQLFDHLFLHPARQVVEQVERLFLVFLERILLAVAAQPDPLFQMVHGEQVIFPQRVHGLQHDDLFQIPHHRRGERLLAVLVLLADPVVEEAFEFVRRDGVLAFPVEVEPQVELAEQVVVEPRPVPVLRRNTRVEMGRHDFVDQIVENIQDLAFEILPGQKAAALLVDDLALFVDDVVVFQQVLADVEVVALDAALGVFDGARHQAVFDGLALLHAEFVHDLLHPFGAEDAQQVVFERQEEARRARIALPAGASA